MTLGNSKLSGFLIDFCLVHDGQINNLDTVYDNDNGFETAEIETPDGRVFVAEYNLMGTNKLEIYEQPNEME